MTKPTLLLEAHLKALRLPTFLREYDKVARHCAQEGLDCPRYLFRLCELERLADTEAVLTGTTFDGTPIQGTDTIQVVP